jgi:hypothetical protein
MAEPDRETQPAAEAPAVPAPPREAPVYSLSEVTSAAAALAAIAPKLKEAALRLAAHLAAAAEHQPHHTITASTRELSEKTGLVPSSLNRAINELCDPQRGLVTARRGCGNRTTAYQVNFLETVRGAFFGEAPRKKASPQTELSLEKHGASFGEAPPEVNRALASTAALLDNFRVQNPTLDRVLNSKISDFDRPTIQIFRSSIHSYMAKFGVDDRDRRYLDTGAVPHPPDDSVMARFLAVAEPFRLMPMIETLILDAKQEEARHVKTGTFNPHNYAWFVYVALSRVAGIHFEVTKKAEQQFRLHKRGQRAAPSTPAPPAQPGELFDAADYGAAAARLVKGIR